MSAWTISGFRAEFCKCNTQSHCCVAPFHIYRGYEDNTLSDVTLILQARSTGKAIYSLYVKALLFCCNLTCFWAFPPFDSLKLAMEKMIVKWTEGRSKGALFLLWSFERSLRCLSPSFSIVVHKVQLLVFAIFNPNAQKIHVPPRGRSASYHTTICGCLHGTTTEFLGKS